MTIYILIGIFIGTILGIAVFFAGRYFLRRRLYALLDTTLFLVKIPKESPPAGGGERDFKPEINKFEQLLSSLASLKKPFVFEVAVPHVGEEIHFYIAAPRFYGEVVAKQIQSIWNGASVERQNDDYNIFNIHGATSAAYIAQKENYALPLRTYAELGLDSFAPIVGGFAKMNEVGEGAALQIILRPAEPDTRKRIQGQVDLLKRGAKPEDVFRQGLSPSFKDVKLALSSQGEEKAKQEKTIDEDAIKALDAKVSKPLFQANIRIVTSAGSKFQSDTILDGLVAGFSQFSAPRRNELRIVKQKNPSALARQFIYREFAPSQSVILSTEEVASIYHFPISSTETPRVKWLKSKDAPPPSNLSTEGLLIGESAFRDEKKSVYITDEDRRRHVYIIGQTGTGKSTLLGNMVIEDVRSGKGIAIIDPHGDLVNNALGFIPKERLDDLIYFDPGDLERPLGLNMLDYNPSRPEEKTFIVNEMQSIFNKLFSQETMGPMFEQYMRNGLLLLMEDMQNEPATLVEVPRIFTDSEWRRRKLARISNPVVIDFWEKEAIKAGGEASLANMTPYITSKFNNFIANDYMRPIIGQAKSAFNFREAMDQGKILLINLSKGRIGDINANLLGMLFTGKILMAALSRVDIPDVTARKDFYLYIDEFQNFTTDSISTILSEARKYRLDLTVVHQFIAQLTEEIRDSIFGNVGSEIVFRVGVQDAEFLVKQFEPTFSENDLMNIDNLNAYAKILINGETSKPFNIRIPTTSWNAGSKELAARYKEYSRLKYGKDRREIEAEIYKRLRE